MSSPLFQVRDWTPEDHVVITEWRRVRGVVGFPAALVPPNAVILTRDGDPVAFAALFISIPREGGASLGQCEGFTVVPGLSLKETRDCAREILVFFRMVCRASGAVIMTAQAEPVVARVLTGLGMQSAGNLQSLIEIL